MARETQMPMLDTVTLSADGGLCVTILNLGATVGSIRVPVADGWIDVALSYPDLEAYRTDTYYVGSTVGRFANRIANARFDLDGHEVVLDANDSPSGNCLHGGKEGISRQYFQMTSAPDGRKVICSHESPHGSCGFPGNLAIEITYELIETDALAIDYRATSDCETVVSLANHVYFNLGGSLGEHTLRLWADAYTPVNEHNIPTGEIRDVSGSRFDLRRGSGIGDARFDHNFVLPDAGGDLVLAAELWSPESNVELLLSTTQPGLQLYTADFLQAPFACRAGLCLEAQAFPDAPNHANFPSARLAAGAEYRQRTVYRFRNRPGPG